MPSKREITLELNAKIQKLEAKLKEAEAKVEKSRAKIEKSNNLLSSSFSRLGGVIAGAFTVEAIVSFSAEAVKLAAKAEGVRNAFTKLNQKDLLNDLRKATRDTISDFQLMQVSIKAENFKIPLTELATLLEFAQKRANQTGESVDYLVDSIINGIGRKSALVLDNLGISATELQDEVKKTGDFAKATGNIVRRELQKMGDVALTTADKFAQMNAEIENIKVGVGDALIKITSASKDILEWWLNGPGVIYKTVFDYIFGTDEELDKKVQKTKTVIGKVWQMLPDGSKIQVLPGAEAVVEAEKILEKSSKEIRDKASGTINYGFAFDQSKIKTFNAPNDADFQKVYASIKKYEEEASQYRIEQEQYYFDLATSNAARLGYALEDAFSGHGETLLSYMNQALQVALGISRALNQDDGSLGGALGVAASIVPGLGLLGNLFKAEGGPVSASSTYIVGEKGPELFTPKTSGYIVPNNQLGSNNNLESGKLDALNMKLFDLIEVNKMQLNKKQESTIQGSNIVTSYDKSYKRKIRYT